MKIRIEEEIYEGTPSEIMESLWDGSFDKNQFPDLDRYITYMCSTFERMTDIPCDIPNGTTDERAHALLLRLAEIDALEVVEDE